MKKLIAVTAVVTAAVLVMTVSVLFYKNGKGREDIQNFGPAAVRNSEENGIIQNSQSNDPSENSGAKLYESPVDFESLTKINPDIYAWIYLPDTNISYPILQGEDNSFYIKHNEYSEYSGKGAIFTEDYNNKDFSDPVTLIYGHNMKDETMFGSLQRIYDTLDEIIIYLPSCEKRYHVFAAVPYSDLHILYYYDFTQERVFNAFFRDIMAVRAVNTYFNKEIQLSPTDHIIILSTCMSGNNQKRFLVCAKEEDT